MMGRGKLSGVQPGRKPCGWPRQWLFTDAVRLPDPLPLIRRLPRGTGVIFRHYDLPGREALGREVALLCRARGLPLLLAGAAPLLPRHLAAAGHHLPQHQARGRGGIRRRKGLVMTAACHDLPAIIAAARLGAGAVFVSPVFVTASHRDALPLGPVRFAGQVQAARRQGMLVYALGGISAASLQRLSGLEIAGFGAIGQFQPA